MVWKMILHTYMTQDLRKKHSILINRVLYKKWSLYCILLLLRPVFYSKDHLAKNRFWPSIEFKHDQVIYWTFRNVKERTWINITEMKSKLDWPASLSMEGCHFVVMYRSMVMYNRRVVMYRIMVNWLRLFKRLAYTDLLW